MGPDDDEFENVDLGGSSSKASSKSVLPDESRLESTDSQLRDDIKNLKAALSMMSADKSVNPLQSIGGIFNSLEEERNSLILEVNNRLHQLHFKLIALRGNQSETRLDSPKYLEITGNIRKIEELLHEIGKLKLPANAVAVPAVAVPAAVVPAAAVSAAAVSAAAVSAAAVSAAAVSAAAVSVAATVASAAEPLSSGRKRSSVLSNIADGALAVGYGLVAGPFVGGSELTTKEQKNRISWLSPVGFFANVYNNRMLSNFNTPTKAMIAAASTAVLAPVFVALIPVNMVLGINAERNRGTVSGWVRDYLNLSQKNQAPDIQVVPHEVSTQVVTPEKPHIVNQRPEQRAPALTASFRHSLNPARKIDQGVEESEKNEVVEKSEKKHKLS